MLLYFLKNKLHCNAGRAYVMKKVTFGVLMILFIFASMAVAMTDDLRNEWEQFIALQARRARDRVVSQGTVPPVDQHYLWLRPHTPTDMAQSHPNQLSPQSQVVDQQPLTFSKVNPQNNQKSQKPTKNHRPKDHENCSSRSEPNKMRIDFLLNKIDETF